MGDGKGSKRLKAATSTESGVVPKLWEDDPEATRTTPTWMGIPQSSRPVKRPALVVMTGSAAGRVLPIRTTKITVGRSKQADFTLSDEGVSRMHCGITHEGCAHYLTDLGSTHGTLVNGRRVEEIELKSGDLIQVGLHVVVQFDYFDDAGDELASKLYEGATRDLLTRALNKRAFEERLTAEVAYAARHGTKLTSLAIAVEGLEAIAEPHGAAARDAVLREVAATIADTLRSEDVFARQGDVTFVVLGRGLSTGEASTLAERIRACVEKLVVTFETHALSVTVSTGVAELGEAGAGEALIQLAERRREQAEREGYDRPRAKT